jgi:hypothetical protein
MITKDQLIELLFKSVPYPNQIKNIDTATEDAVYFTWRSSRYKATCNPLSVMKLDVGCLVGDDASILMTQCLKNKIGEVI